MLQSIRERAQSWMAWIIVILITIPFALWGIHQYFGGGGDVVVATVNGEDITRSEFQQAYYEHRQRLQNLLGANFRPEAFDETLMKQSVIDRLIQDRLLTEAALKSGYRIGDNQLAFEIQMFDAFHRDGRFDQVTYEQTLRQQGMTSSMFETRLRHGMLLRQIEQGIQASALATRWETDNILRLKEQQREVGYFIVPHQRYTEAVSIEEEAIKDYYKTHLTQFMTPETVHIEYIELALDSLAEQVPAASDDTLRQLYEERRDELKVPEERRAAHILLKLAKDADKQAVAKATAEAQGLLKRLKAGEDFADLAKQYSQDPGSAKQGGDLGFFGRGVMTPEFESAVFAMEPNELSGPVRSDFGLHIIKLLEIRPESIKSFAEARDQLMADYKQRQAEDLFYEQADILANLVYEHPDTLTFAAEALGITVKDGGLLTRAGGEGIGSNRAVITAAFSEDVLLQGNNSEPIELDANHLVALRVKDHQSPTQQPLEEVRQAIVAQLRTKAAREQARELGEQLVEQLRDSADPQALAEAHDLEWKTRGLVKRDSTGVNPAVLQRVFKMPKPRDDKWSVAGAALASGDYAVIALTSVKDGIPTEASEATHSSIALTLERNEANSEYSALVHELWTHADIVVQKDNL